HTEKITESSYPRTPGLDSTGLGFVGHVSDGVISVDLFVSLAISIFLITVDLFLSLLVWDLENRGPAFALLLGSNITAFSAEEIPCISAVVVALFSEILLLEAPQLVTLLKEMKDGLDAVRSKVQALTAKVKADQFPTVEGISYLETKHLLLLNYCQSLVYYLLRKAKGFSIEGHPVVRSLIEIRLFLEKIRPIDKKLQYQIQKLTKVAAGGTDNVGVSEKEADVSQKTEDLLKYRPNPDMLVGKTDEISQDGVYKPPKFAPTSMEEDKMSKQERKALRREKNTLRQAGQSAFVRELMDDLEGRPEEIREIVGTESAELNRYKAKWQERARCEEELFIRAPLTKLEKKREKHLKKSRNGLLGLTDSFYDEIKSLPLESEETADPMGDASRGIGKLKKRKRKY
ncbi:Sas10/Utp3/C1D, partial [Parasponia andersonii]